MRGDRLATASPEQIVVRELASGETRVLAHPSAELLLLNDTELVFMDQAGSPPRLYRVEIASLPLAVR